MSSQLEQVEAYWTKTPCNSKRSRFPAGTLGFFTEISLNKKTVEPHLWEFTDFPAWQNKTVLELGCGLGTAAVQFASHGAKYTGIDLSSESIALAKLNAEANRLVSPIFLQGNMEELTVPTPVGGWDLIYAWGSIHHTPSPIRALDVTRMYCSPWTELRIMLYHKWSWKMIEGWLRFDKRTEAVEGCPVAYTYTVAEAHNIVEDAGFEVTSIHVDHIFPYRIPDYVMGKYVRRWIFKKMPANWFKWLESKFGFHILITARPK